MVHCRCLLNPDVSIFRVNGPYTASVYLELEQTGLDPGTAVDVIGVYNAPYILSMDQGPIDGDLLDGCSFQKPSWCYRCYPRRVHANLSSQHLEPLAFV